MNLFEVRKKSRKKSIKFSVVGSIITVMFLIWEGAGWGLSMFFFLCTIGSIIGMLDENQDFAKYEQLYGLKKIQKQLDDDPMVFYFSGKPILYITDDYFISTTMGIRIEHKKNIVEVKDQICRDKSGDYVCSILLITTERERWQILRVLSNQKDKKWDEFTDVCRRIQDYFYEQNNW